MIAFPSFIYYSISILMGAFSFFCFCSIYTRQRMTIKKFVVIAAISSIQTINLLLQMTNLQVVFSTFVAICGLYFVYHQRGMKLLIGIILYTIIGLIGDTITGITMLSIFGMETTEMIASEENPLYMLMNLFCFSLIILLSWLFYLVFQRIRRISIKSSIRIIRSVLLPGALIAVWVYNLNKVRFTDRAQQFYEILPVTIFVFAALIISLTYIVQDIRYVHQQQMNSTLLEQKKIQDALLEDTRIFRHNIANLLYGFQGTVMSGNVSDIREYYERMADTCRIINNENVTAIQRIPSLPIHSLLMAKIQAANAENIPFYVYTDDNLIWRGWNDKDMCEALGVLLDNALEAARDSAAPLVTFELHNAGNDMETVVRNTCRDINTVLNKPSKEGHDGLGLISLKKMVDKHANSIFNLYTKGRFIEAHMLLR